MRQTPRSVAHKESLVSVPSLARFRRCTKCGCTKPETPQFYVRERRPGRPPFQPRCKACDTAYKKRNKERYRAYLEKWNALNPARAAELKRRWKEKNRDVYRAAQNKRRAAVSGERGAHSAEELSQMYRDQDGRCAYCEVALDGSYHVDHMVPLSRGGANDWSNIAIACPRCNWRKNDQTAEEFMNSLDEKTARKLTEAVQDLTKSVNKLKAEMEDSNKLTRAMLKAAGVQSPAQTRQPVEQQPAGAGGFVDPLTQLLNGQQAGT